MEPLTSLWRPASVALVGRIPPDLRAPLDAYAAGGHASVTDIGLRVEDLATRPPAGLAVIAGEPNWHTVHRTLELLCIAARAHRRRPPVIVVLDVDWPHGRRDRYLPDSLVPERHRLPSRLGGLQPGIEEPTPGAGLDSEAEHALVEGGPRNGVRTALEDALAVFDDQLELYERPGFGGVALLVPLRTRRSRAQSDHLKEWRLGEAHRQVLVDLERARLEAAVRVASAEAEERAAHAAAEKAGIVPGAPDLEALRAELADVAADRARLRLELGERDARLAVLRAELAVVHGLLETYDDRAAVGRIA